MIRALIAACLALGACSTENILALGRNQDVCEANLPPECSTAPRCVLDPDEYLDGKFPGAKAFIVRTDGAATVKFSLLLQNPKGSGTELLLRMQESNCSDIYTFDNAGRDVVRLANTDGIITIPLQVTRAGDHPVEITSDAYLDWSLAVEIQNVDATTME
jgi:hypothetical protein